MFDFNSYYSSHRSLYLCGSPPEQDIEQRKHTADLMRPKIADTVRYQILVERVYALRAPYKRRIEDAI
jgi:hypothetical protein